MTGSEYKLIPLQKTWSIPVDWKFSQDEYDKLVKGHQSNWCVFLRDDVVHFCRIGGEEFYRFSVKKSSSGSYTSEVLETYIVDYNIELGSFAVEETVGLLLTYFGIDIERGKNDAALHSPR